MSTVHALGAPQDSTPATIPGLQATEWSIFVCDPIQGRANGTATVASTLPKWIESVRPPASGKSAAPSPISIIRFTGQTDQKIKVRLTGLSKTVFCAAWPPARVRSQEIVWSDLTLSSIPPLREQRQEDWLVPLEKTWGTYVVDGDRSEAFLLYDVEFPFTVPLVVYPGKATADGIQVESFASAPLHDLVIYRPPHDGCGWTTGSLPEVAPKFAADAATPPINLSLAPPAANADHPQDVLATDWRDRLRPWELDPADLELIIKTLQSRGLDDRQLTAIFRLDESVLNQLIPLEITPQPARIRRLALIVVRNIDPSLPLQIDQLIAQLGDRDWHVRENATRLLAGYAPAADSKLRSALQSKDPEVVLRAERLLARDSTR